MSTVFQALDTVLERPVAIKLLAEHLAQDEAFVARFRREALAAARLQHPNVVQVFDSGEDASSERHFIVMELVDGPSCADLLRDSGTLEVASAVRSVRDACHGLDYAHRASVVHRDVKPGNLLISHETGVTKLADFGIAKAAAQSRITQVGSVLGTAAYLSPEQARGEEAGPPSDIYSLGVCAYQFLTGRLPHEYESLTELALKQQNDQVEPITAHRQDVPAALDRAIRLCLERDQESRYTSALELAEAVEAGMRGEDTEATQRLAPTGRRRRRDTRTTRATRAMRDDAATQALQTGNRGPARPAPGPQRQAQPRPDPAAVRKRRLRALALLVTALLAVVAIALVAGSGDDQGRDVQPVRAPDIPQQVQGIEELIRNNTQ